MNRFVITAAASLLLTSIAAAHCQVPCGIYDDQRRFELMLEDEQTVAKAQDQLDELSDQSDPQSINQQVRWVTNKEFHANRIQQTMLEYFLAQRIKADSPDRIKQLVAAHDVIVAAMKAKQSADSKTALALEEAIFNFYRAYEGKEPDFEHSH